MTRLTTADLAPRGLGVAQGIGRRVDPISPSAPAAVAKKVKSIKGGGSGSHRLGAGGNPWDAMAEALEGMPPGRDLATLILPPLSNRTLKPEEQLSHDVAWMLAAMARQGRLRSLPVCASTEHRGGGQRAMLSQMLKRQIGAWPGQPDWLFVGPFFGVLELKRPRQGKTSKGQLSDEQKDCRAVCLSMGIPHAVAHTVDEARKALEEMGVIEGASA